MPASSRAKSLAPEAARSDARRAAFEILLRVEKGAFLDALLGPAINEMEDTREAALLTRLAYGVETWRRRLDWTLAGFSRTPLDDLEPAVRTALRLGLFQILLLDRVPAHAAVDTSVDLAKRRSKAGASVVNAILRRALREGERRAPPEEDDGAHFLSIVWSHPEWLVRRWLDERGRERTEALLRANVEPGPSTFRVDRRSLSREAALAELTARGVVAHPSEYADTAITIEGPVGAVRDLPWLAPQGIASQIVARMVAPAPGERLLDLCAAPGGKAAALAESIGRGLVVAADRTKGGIARTGELRSGRDALAVVRADGTRPPLRSATFDAVLVDAPCSGLGTLRAHPELRWRRTPDDIERLSGLQRRLLAEAADLVRAGGRLIYATCSPVTDENEDVVRDFLAARGDWRPENPRPRLGEAARFVGDDLALRTSPDDEGLDGFFAVVLRNDAGPV